CMTCRLSPSQLLRRSWVEAPASGASREIVTSSRTLSTDPPRRADRRGGRRLRKHKLSFAGIHRRFKMIALWEPRSGVAVVAHAEHDEIGGQGQVGDARPRGGHFPILPPT